MREREERREGGRERDRKNGGRVIIIIITRRVSAIFFTSVQHVECVYNAVIASSEDDDEFLDGDGLVPVPGLGRGTSGGRYLPPFEI